MRKLFRNQLLLGLALMAVAVLAGAQTDAKNDDLSTYDSLVSAMPPFPPPAMTVTWDDCVALAARKNPTLVASEYAQAASRATYISSYDGIMPSVALTNTYSRNNTINGVAVGQQQTYEAAATANWNIFSMAQVASIRSAGASYSQAQANLRLASATLRYNLFVAYVNAYFAARNIEVNKQILAIEKKNAEEVALRYSSGDEYKGSMMNANALYLGQLINVSQAERSWRAAVASLDQQLGFDEFTQVAVTGTIVAQQPPNFPANMSQYLAIRPDVAVQEAVVKSARASLASAEAPLYPTFSGTYSRYRENPWEFPTQRLWTVGATLSYPIFGSGPISVLYNVKSAKNTLANQENTLRAVRVAAVANLESTWASYANAVDQAVGQLALTVSYRQRNTEGEVRYASGLLSFDNYQVIITQWVSAEQSLLSAQQQAVTAQAAWEQSLGKALGE